MCTKHVTNYMDVPVCVQTVFEGKESSMRTTLRKVTLAFSAVLAMGTAATSQADMGKTPGSWNVGASGDLSYQIPIWVQPGPKGMQPSLAIAYNSSAGNGTMGVGWSLSGFSSITRCAWTPAEDGGSRAVMVDASDRFCLDGNKLRITSGPLSSYGTTGAVYQTQIADFSRITSVGTAGTGPSSFIVHTKSGLILEYGNTTDSKIILSGTTVYSWLVNKVSDRDGNSYVITYTADNTVGRVPATVSWGNTTTPGVYQYQAAFNYSTKTSSTDFVSANQNSVPLTNKLRLDSITIGYSASGSSYATRRQYLMTYVASPTTGKSRLTEVKECAATTSNCLKPTTINYQNGAAGVGSTPTTAITANAVLSGRYDFNGDGRTDIAYYNGSTWRVMFSTGNGFTSGVDTVISGSTTPVAGRFTAQNQDGFLVNAGGNYSYVGFNGVSFTTTALGVPVPPTPMVLSDFNGDGLQDLVWTSTFGGAPNVRGRVNVRVNTTTGAATAPSFSSSVTTALDTSIGNAGGGGIEFMNIAGCPTDRLCDLNGDGAGDLLVKVTLMNCTGGQGGCSVGVTGYDLMSNFGMSYTLQNATPNAVPAYVGLRFNDDRCTDTLRLSPSQLLNISHCGTGAATPASLPATPLTAFDWDADGKDDLVVNNGGTLGIYRANGTATSPFQSLSTTSIPVTCGTFSYFQSDFDGDGLNELACATSTSVSYYTRNGGGSVGAPAGLNVWATQIPDLVNNITDGFGVAISPWYVSIMQSNYTAGEGTALPLKDSKAAKIVIGRLTVSDGIGASYDLDYEYKGARVHSALKDPATPGTTPNGNVDQEAILGPDGQFAGFEEITVVDSRNGIKHTTVYEQLFPLTGSVKSALSSQVDGKKITETTVVNQVETLDSTAANKRYFRYVSGATSDQYEVGGSLNGDLVTTTTSTYGYTDFTYGNVATETIVVTDRDDSSLPSLFDKTWTTSTTINYDAPLISGSDWCVGFVTQIQTTQSSTAPGATTVTRARGFNPDASAPSKCRVKVATVEPSSAQYKVATTYGFDSFGNVNSVQVVGRQPLSGGGFGDMPSRTTNTNWGSTGVAPVSVTDPSGAESKFEYNPEDGTLKDVIDPNSTVANVIKTSYLYDSFARMIRQTRPDGTYSTWSYEDCVTTGCLYGIHKLTILRANHDKQGALLSDEFAYLDAFARTLVNRVRRLSGTPWDGSYNWNEVQYDSMGFVYKQYMPCTTSSATTSCRTHAVTSTYDLLGRVVQSSRPQSQADSTPQVTSYSYEGRTRKILGPGQHTSARVVNVNGSARQISDANNYAVNFSTDAAGSIVAISDSQSVTRLSNVTIHYGVMPFLVEATDSALGHYTRTYNSLGELIGGMDAEGQPFTATYDSVSRPLTLFQPNSATSSSWLYGSSREDRNVGRLILRSSVANGETYSEAFTYDSQARVQKKRITIPGLGMFDYDVEYGAQSGLIETLTYPTTTPGYRLSLKYSYQNGYLQSVADSSSPSTVFWAASATNSWGQITQETLGGNIQRSRVFDAVTGRLNSIQSGVSGNPTSIQNYAYLYDSVGNVTQRQNLKAGLTESFYYDHVNRLIRSELSSGSTSADNLVLTYDASGNIVEKDELGFNPPLANQSITWTSYNYPAQISSGDETATFSYGPDSERWRMVYTKGAASETTYYIGGLLEVVDSGPTTTFRHTIMGGAGPEAIYSRTSSGTNALRYALLDHQGSTETFVDGAGVTVTNAAFSAFGSRRNASSWSGEPTNRAALDEISRQGYTYHTVLGSMGLNHMNGRVQDSFTGRFLSADPFITHPGYTQNHNRYSYVYNNPVSFTDPSGFDTNMDQYGALMRLYQSQIDAARSASIAGLALSYSKCDANCQFAAARLRHGEDEEETVPGTPTPAVNVRGGGGGSAKEEPEKECYEPFVGGDSFLGSYVARVGNLAAHLLDSVSGGVEGGLAISGSVNFFGIKPSLGGGMFSMGASTTLAGNASVRVKTPTPGNLTYGEASFATGPVKWGVASSSVTEGFSTRTGPFSTPEVGLNLMARASAWKSDFGKLGAHAQIGIGIKVEVDLANAIRAIDCALTTRR